MSIDYNQLNHAVLGSGPMGLLLCSLLSRKLEEVFLWIPEKELAEEYNRTKLTTILNHPFSIPDNVQIISNFLEFERNSWCFHIAVPSRTLEELAFQLMETLDKENEFVFCLFTKGLLTKKSRKLINGISFSDYIQYLVSARKIKNYSIAAINGPSLLQELLEENHSFFHIGSTEASCTTFLAELYRFPFIHCTTTQELSSMEIAGVLKNPIAIATGIASVLPDCGSNLEGELIRMGFREMLSFASAYGLSEEEFLGRSGLADLITTATSPKSRNRNYGKKMIGSLMTGPEKLSIKEKFEIFLNPKAYIEKEVSKWHDTVEGAYALGIILELGHEKNLVLPLYQTLFEVLSRKIPPIAIANLLTGGHTEFPIEKLVGFKKQGMDIAAGYNFQPMLVDRVLRVILSEPGFLSRIKKQSYSTMESIQKRINRAERRGNTEEAVKYKKEFKLWEDFENCTREEERDKITKLIQFYVNEIADSYRPTIRDSLMKVVAPIRLFSGGFRPGSITPILGGEIEKIQQVASKYNLLYAPRHQSHLDSVELAYALNKLNLPIPRYAAASSLMSSPFWEWMLKSLGAYSVDRERNRNTLYLECLRIYSTLLLESGIPSLVYPEGTRSRTGGIVPIKTGILKTAIDAFRNTGSEIIIVPVAISYETVPEDKEFCGIPEKLTMQSYLAKRTSVYLDFCQPLAISQYMGLDDPSLAISGDIVNQWIQYQRILPNQILAKLFVENEFKLPKKKLESLVEEFLLNHPGNYLTTNPSEILQKGLSRLKKMKLIEEVNDSWEATQRDLITYYGNMVPSLRSSEF